MRGEDQRREAAMEGCKEKFAESVRIISPQGKLHEHSQGGSLFSKIWRNLLEMLHYNGIIK